MNTTRTFVISDTHFSRKKIMEHEPSRKAMGWSTVEEMNRGMVERWNAIVGPDDIVWHLGDVAMWKAKEYGIVRELNGRKKLILGNHDQQPIGVYPSVGFFSVHSLHEGNGYVLTHVPIHESQLERWPINIHGHLHGDLVLQQFDMDDQPYGSVCPPDDRYRNVCVEQTNFRPVLLDEVLKNENPNR